MRENRPRVLPATDGRRTRRATPRLDPVLTRSWHTCAVEYARLFDLMTAQRSGPRVIAGWRAILRYLNDVLGIRDRWGERVKRRQVEYWITKYGFPFLPGIKTPRAKYQCVTLERAVDAWILSRPRNGCRDLFSFLDPEHAREKPKAWSGPTAANPSAVSTHYPQSAQTLSHGEARDTDGA